MKITRKNKIRIRKITAIIRNAFLIFSILSFLLSAFSASAESLKFLFIFFGISVVCFGISVGLDQLLWETAWSGDKPSPFHH